MSEINDMFGPRLREIARMGLQLNEVIFHAMESGRVEEKFASNTHQLLKYLEGEPGDGPEALFSYLDRDIAIVREFLDKWDEFKEDEYYQEPMYLAGRILEELEGLAVAWSTLSGVEQRRVIAEAELDRKRASRNRSGLTFVYWILGLFLFIMIVTTLFVHFSPDSNETEIPGNQVTRPGSDKTR